MTTVARHTIAPAWLASAWDRAGVRERRLALAGVTLVVLLVGWAFVWQPLQADIERTQLELTREAARLAVARMLTSESAGLVREAAPPRAADMRTAAARALAQRGLRSAGVPELHDNRVSVVLPDAHFDALAAALDALRKEEGLRVVEATLTPRVEPGTVRAELHLER